jgi:hypothetical protein
MHLTFDLTIVLLLAFRMSKQNQKRSEPESTTPATRSKKAKAQLEPSPTAGPSHTGHGREGPATTESVAKTEGDLAVMNPRLPSYKLLLELAEEYKDLDPLSHKDLALRLGNIYSTFRGLYKNSPPIPEDFVPLKVFEKNITGRDAELLDLLKRAMRENDWKDVVTHGMHLPLR